MSLKKPDKDDLIQSFITDSKADKHAEQPLRYNRPKHSLLKGLLHPLQSMGIVPFHRYLIDGGELLASHQYQDAYNAFLMANHKDSKRIEPYLGMAHALEGKGDKKSLSQAQEHLKKALCIDPNQLSLYDELIHLLMTLGNVQDAQLFKKKQFAAKTLQTNPENPVANNNLGVMFLGQAEFSDALDYFKKASKTKRSPKLAQFNLAKAWFYKAINETEPEEIKKALYQSELELNKLHGINHDVYGLLLRSKIALHRNEYQLAKNLLTRASKLDATVKEVFATLQIVEEHLGNIHEARLAYDAYRSLNNRK